MNRGSFPHEISKLTLNLFCILLVQERLGKDAVESDFRNEISEEIGPFALHSLRGVVIINIGGLLLPLFGGLRKSWGLPNWRVISLVRTKRLFVHQCLWIESACSYLCSRGKQPPVEELEISNRNVASLFFHIEVKK